MSGNGVIGLRVESFASLDNRPGWCSTSNSMTSGELTEETSKKPFLVRHWSTLSRILSLLLLAVLWGLVLLALHGENRNIGFYLVFLSSLVSFIETSYILDWLFCGRESKDTRLQNVWRLILGISTWKRLLAYVVLSIPAFTEPRSAPITLGCGILINLIGLLEFIHLFREKNKRKPITYRQLGIY